MEGKYIDYLLAEKQDGSLALVVIEAHNAEVGHLVEFNNGELGRVIAKAWVNGGIEGEVHNVVAAMIPTYEAEAVYWRGWKKEANDGTAPGNP